MQSQGGSLHPVSIEGAKEELAALEQRQEGGTRRALVLKVLLQELRVLNRTAFLMQSRLKEARRRR